MLKEIRFALRGLAQILQRTHEMGVRMALGAQRADLLGLVNGRALKLVAVGTATGLLLALFSTRALQALLYQVSAFDAPTFLLVTLILGAIAPCCQLSAGSTR